MTDWLWEMKEREVQKERTLKSIKNLDKSFEKNEAMSYTDDEEVPKPTIDVSYIYL